MAKKSTTKKATRKKEDPNLQNILSQLNEIRMGLYDLRMSLRDPQRVEVEPWKPKTGLQCVVLGPNMVGLHSVYAPVGSLHKLTRWQLDDADATYYLEPANEWFPRRNVRPATSEEITLYKQEEEARLKKEKEEAKLEFGTKVTTGAHGTVYRIACFEPDSGGQWRLIRENAGPHSSFLAKRSEFQIIDPQ